MIHRPPMYHKIICCALKLVSPSDIVQVKIVNSTQPKLALIRCLPILKAVTVTTRGVGLNTTAKRSPMAAKDIEPLQWLLTKGFYTKNELGKLCSCLGYPNNLLLNCLHDATKVKFSLRREYLKFLAGKPLEESFINQLLESKYLKQCLEKRFNRQDAKHNIKVIKKAMWLLRHQKMSFNEISEGRVAFEVYCCEDGSGLLVAVENVLLALKMVEKVISSSKLECEIQKQQHIADVPSRIQLYEFFDLVLLTKNSVHVELEMKSNSDEEKVTSIASIPNLDQMWMTSDQKILTFLDEQYKLSLYKEVKSASETIEEEHVVSSAPRRYLKALSKEQLHAICPSLEFSQSQLHQARGRAVVQSGRSTGNFISLSSSRKSFPSVLQADFEGPQSQYVSRRARWQSPSKRSLRKLAKFPQMSITEEKASPEQAKHPVFNERVESALKSRETLPTSFSGILQLTNDSSASRLFSSPQTPYSDTSRPCTEPEPGRRQRPLLCDPIVSPEELHQHQGQMDDLRWASLKLNPAYEISRPPTSFEVSCSIHDNIKCGKCAELDLIVDMVQDLLSLMLFFIGVGTSFKCNTEAVLKSSIQST